MPVPRPETTEVGRAVRSVIRAAIADPGSRTASEFLEEEPAWKARAVVLALAASGYRIVPAGPEGSPG
jgi:hypothetical protein